MPTIRGWTAVSAGLALWVASRLIGSPDLHLLAAGILSLPLLATLFVRWSRVRLAVRRRLSPARVFAGGRASVDLTVENLGRRTTSFLLLEDEIPAAMGPPARLVVTGVPPRNHQSASYQLVCRRRGRFRIGPLSIYLSDPFGLARTKFAASGAGELLVYPAVEDVDVGHLLSQGVGSGESTARQLHRSLAEFYTMREYVTGDDLRRIHWPSVARTGRLMIRQDESTRRSSATVFLDNRVEALGPRGSQAFERAVSVAASIGRAFVRAGFAVQLATAEAAAKTVSEERLLEALASVELIGTRGPSNVLRSLRAGALTDSTLILVTAPPAGPDLATITGVGAAFGRRLAVLVHPQSPSGLGAQGADELGRRATAARRSLMRAGWEVLVMAPEGRLEDVWQHTTKTRAAADVSSR